MAEKKRAFAPAGSLFMLHGSVLLFGLAGVIGREVSLPAVLLTLGRVVFSSLTLLAVLALRRQSVAPAKKAHLALFLAAGAVLALHWASFLQSVQTAGVAVGTVTYSTFPLFVTFLEPLLFKEKLRGKDVLCALLMLAGVAVLIPPGAEDGAGLLAGVGWGLCSSFTYAVLSLLNRAFGRQGGYSSAAICFYEQAFAALLLLPALWLVPARPTGRELALVAVLGVVCTALAHTLFVQALKKVRVQIAGLVSGMESVYGILLAALLLGQAPTLREALGCAIVLGATVWATRGAKQQKE